MLLTGAEDIEIVGEATGGGEVAQAVADHEPDVVLMDIRMPGMDGLAATELLRPMDRRAGGRRPHDVRGRRLRPAGPARRRGRVPPQGHSAGRDRARDPGRRRRRAHALADDHPPADRPRDREQWRRPEAGGPGALDRLTDRGREVAVAIGLGKSNAEISRELYMRVATVKAHVSRILEKLELNNHVQIALLAHDAGEV
jgi:DNA-binding NarL/FixJ family response regulator